jgi:hypothetical protein
MIQTEVICQPADRRWHAAVFQRAQCRSRHEVRLRPGSGLTNSGACGNIWWLYAGAWCSLVEHTCLSSRRSRVRIPSSPPIPEEWAAQAAHSSLAGLVRSCLTVDAIGILACPTRGCQGRWLFAGHLYRRRLGGVSVARWRETAISRSSPCGRGRRIPR